MQRRIQPVLCALLLALAFPSLANATFPGANGRIAYECWPEICVTNPAGTLKKKLTSWEHGYRYAPSFSSNGRRIAFARTLGRDRTELFLMRSDGTHVRRLTHSPRHTFNQTPQFIPGGRRLVFERPRGGIFVIELLTGEIVRIGTGSSPAVSPDGQSIAFLRSGPTSVDFPKLWVMGIDGSSPTRVSSAGTDVTERDPNWTPDGERIAFSHDGEGERGIFTIRPDGSDLTRVTPAADFPAANSPAISPDGQRLALVGDHQCEDCEHFLALHEIGSGAYDLVRRVEPGTQPDWGPKP